jgi:hypothetical protein
MVEQAKPERRRDVHRQVLIDVAIRLQKHYGTDYARQYLADVNIPALTIDRVLSSPQLRQPAPAGACLPRIPAESDRH